MLHHAPTPAPENDFVTLTDDELARVDGGFIQMLGALLNVAGPLISQLTHKSRRSGDSSNGSSDSGSSSSDGNRNQPSDQDTNLPQNGSHSSGGFNIGSLLGLCGLGS